MTKKQDIERLALLLEGDRSAHAEAAEDEQALGSLATLLREAQPTVEPMNPEFRAELRAQVVEAARARTAEPALMTRLRDRVERFKYSTGLATATGIASVSLAGGGVAGAAEHAQPGELLYPTKLAIEDARLALDLSDATRGRRALSYAGERIEEASAAAERGDMEGAETALRSAADRTREGREAVSQTDDETAVLDMVDALSAQARALAALAPSLSGGAADAADELADEVREGLEEAGQRLQIPPVAPPGLPGDDGTSPPAGDLPPAGDTSPAPAPDDQAPGGDTTQPDGPGEGVLPDPALPPVDLPDVDTPAIPLPVPEQPATTDQPEIPLDTAPPEGTTGTAPDTPDAPDTGTSDLSPPASGGVGQPVDELIDAATGAAGEAVQAAPAGGAIDAVTGGLTPEGQ